MFWSYDDVMEKLGAAAQATAGGIVVLVPGSPDEGRLPKHIKVAQFVGDSFVVTAEGLEYLGESEGDETKAPVKAIRKPKKAAEEVAQVPLDDLDI